ncbi:MAG: protease-like activity factor CPAF [Parachlamydiaceae bacterium]|nr:protease-like activity factor CPAF [Parachlamydiaceae bacterium]
MNFFAFPISLLLLVSFNHVWSYETPSQSTVKQQMLQDLDVIENAFRVNYAPAEWKKNYCGWDLHEQINSAKQKVTSANYITIYDYQRILKDFFKSTQDYHVSPKFYSTASAMLPFRVHSAQGRYFLAWVSPSIAGDLKKGDEILLFDGQHIDEAVAQIKERECGNPLSATDQGCAEELLTARLGSQGHQLPNGKVEIVVRNFITNEIATHPFEWERVEECVSPGPYRSRVPLIPDHHEKAEEINSLLSLEMTAALYPPLRAAHDKRAKSHYHSIINEVKGDWDQIDISALTGEKNHSEADEVLDNALEELDGLYSCLWGDFKGPLPDLGRTIWRASRLSGFRAYIYKNAKGKKIGYVRIPDFMPDCEHTTKDLNRLIALFETYADVLVIDQLNNPGGQIMYMYSLLAMLTIQPMELPKQQQLITQKQVYQALKTLKNFRGNDHESFEELDLPEAKCKAVSITDGMDLMKLYLSLVNYSEFIVNEWEAGNIFTQPYSAYGMIETAPHPWGRFTKPVLVLVNHMDTSSADIFPAILQDNKRATIFGSRTAGAGGVLIQGSHPNLFGLAHYKMTGSVVLRRDGSPIENLGVTPDILYEMTPEDLEGARYHGYIKAVNAAVNKLLQRK